MDDLDSKREELEGRRDFIRKTAYVVPAVLTLQAFSAVAKAGSEAPAPGVDQTPTTDTKPKKPKKNP